MDWIGKHLLDFLPFVLIAAGVWWLMPSAAARPRIVGLLLAIAGIGLLAIRADDFTGPLPETVMFWLFAATAIMSATLVITNRNPVYSALWFAMATLSVCGLFLLQYAAFLAAATVVIYAGAIVVTFVFVIMLAQQTGATAYDQRSRQPFLATFAALSLLLVVVGTILFASEKSVLAQNAMDRNRAQRTEEVQRAETLRLEAAPQKVTPAANPMSQLQPEQPLGPIRELGRSLFGDYLFAVELAGTLLLIATIGAIAIAPRRRRGTL